MAKISDSNAAGEVEISSAAHHRHIAARSAFDYLIGKATDAFGDVFGAELGKLGDTHAAEADVSVYQLMCEQVVNNGGSRDETFGIEC